MYTIRDGRVPSLSYYESSSTDVIAKLTHAIPFVTQLSSSHMSILGSCNEISAITLMAVKQHTVALYLNVRQIVEADTFTPYATYILSHEDML